MAQRSIISFLTHQAPTSPDGGAATLAQALDARVREGELIEKLSDHAVRCFACGHRCLVKPGRRGICKVRFNRDGTLYVPAGYVAALQCDPTEKKPFFHALPGSDTLTFGMLGCDFHCGRSEEHTSELQSHSDLVCRLLLEKKKETDTVKISK